MTFRSELARGYPNTPKTLSFGAASILATRTNSYGAESPSTNAGGEAGSMTAKSQTASNCSFAGRGLSTLPIRHRRGSPRNPSATSTVVRSSLCASTCAAVTKTEASPNRRAVHVPRIPGYSGWSSEVKMIGRAHFAALSTPGMSRIDGFISFIAPPCALPGPAEAPEPSAGLHVEVDVQECRFRPGQFAATVAPRDSATARTSPAIGAPYSPVSSASLRRPGSERAEQLAGRYRLPTRSLDKSLAHGAVDFSSRDAHAAWNRHRTKHARRQKPPQLVSAHAEQPG